MWSTLLEGLDAVCIPPDKREDGRQRKGRRCEIMEWNSEEAGEVASNLDEVSTTHGMLE